MHDGLIHPAGEQFGEPDAALGRRSFGRGAASAAGAAGGQHGYAVELGSQQALARGFGRAALLRFGEQDRLRRNLTDRFQIHALGQAGIGDDIVVAARQRVEARCQAG